MREACPPSSAYRLRKFLNRNRGPALAAAAVVLLALVAGIAGTTAGLVRAERERRVARDAEENEREQSQRADRSRQEAVRRLAQIEKSTDVLGAIFQDLDPNADEKEGRPLRAVLADRLKRAAAGLDGEAVGDPLTVAKLQTILGKALLGTADVAEAVKLLEKAAATGVANFGDEHPNTLTAHRTLAVAYQKAGRLDLAIPLYERTLKGCESTMGDNHPYTLRTRANLAGAYQFAGKFDLAIPLHERTLEAQEVTLGGDHPSTLSSLNNLASAYWQTQRFDQSVPRYEDLLRRWRARSGDEHPMTFLSAFNLGVNYRDAGRQEEAVATFDKWLPRAAAKLLPGQYPLPFGRWAALETYVTAGRHDKAALLLEDVSALREELKPDDPQLAGVLARLGLTLLKAGKPANAEPLLRECLAIREKKEPDGWATFNTRAMLGGALLGQKKYAEAEPLLVEGYKGMKQRQDKIPPQGKPRLREALEQLVQMYEATGNKAEAARWRKDLDATKPAAKK